MMNLDQHTITEAVLARMVDMPDSRLKVIITSLVHHMHDFARDIKLTEAEWIYAIQFLTSVGQKCDDKRQEFILLSDVLGLSMLTVAMNNEKPKGCTEATVVGPFHVEDAPHYEHGGDVGNGAVGQPCHVSAVVKGLDGKPIANAVVNVWQADAAGHYDVQYTESDALRARGILHTDANGKFHFKSILAEPYPVPHDGPVGQILNAMNRHPWRPAHLHFMVEAPGFERLITHVFRRDGKYLESDAVFGVRQSLIADWIEKADGSYTLDFEFIMNPLSA